MKIQVIILFGTLMLNCANIFGQKEYRIGIELETEIHNNYGSIDTYAKITDGYSSGSKRQSVGVSLQYKTVGFRFSKFDLELKGPGFANPFNLIGSTYNNFPRLWSGKGGSYHGGGYLFEGYSIGIYKVFRTKLFDIEVDGNYAKFDVKLNGGHPSNLLFSYSYNTKKDFQSRHWAYYDGGNYYGFGVKINKRIWKGIKGYIGMNVRNGTFNYVFNEKVRDEIIEENNLDISTQDDKKFNSFGLIIGLKYQFGFGKAYD